MTPFFPRRNIYNWRQSWWPAKPDIILKGGGGGPRGAHKLTPDPGGPPPRGANSHCWKQSTFFNPQDKTSHPNLTLWVIQCWVWDVSYWSVVLWYSDTQHNVGLSTGPHFHHMFFTSYTRPPPSPPLLRRTGERFMIKLCYPPPPPSAGLIQRAIIASNTNTDWPSFDRTPLMRSELWLYCRDGCHQYFNTSILSTQLE